MDSKNYRNRLKNIIKSVVGLNKKNINEGEEIKKVCFYYGYPSSISDSYDLNEVISVYKNYNIIVFGDEYQKPEHEDYHNTIKIIQRLRNEYPHIEIFGYVPCAAENGGKNLDIKDIKYLIDLWSNLGVTGIFYDEFGYDYGNTRVRQNQLVSYGKSLGLNAFVNSWSDTYIYSSEPIILDWMNNFEPNPNKIKPVIDSNDYSLYENLFWSVNGKTQICSEPARIYKAYEYYNTSKDEYGMTWHKRFGTKTICLDGIYSNLSEEKKIELKTITILSSILLKIDGIAFGDENWGASGHYEDWNLPDIKKLYSEKKHNIKCRYESFPKGYKAAINGEKLELVWDIPSEKESSIDIGSKEIRLNGNIIRNCFEEII